MDTWTLKDGSTVELGGTVHGKTSEAAHVLAFIEMSKRGQRVNSGYGAEPSTAALDVNVPHLMDSFLRRIATVVKAPKIDYPKIERRDNGEPTGEVVIY